ncbi:GGDEF domain-containing protein [Halomonas urumqiensis]|uniref:diguanylate cyclase n=1 Tax=Halomonas urumqiensis TaxID=1684789 RepID=A0A2N7UEP7_9GAMM|nr:GGDEF domain-containing protein [Halomonas urumqiensis]PMR78861.1 GGDEF domain-containing protein [Halomonas urumqiensis]PTB04234.1 diguanylate cyclase [Halomonas urumqiensis]GHE19491.1 hypothetical protein GCM10017767_00120 [Halomonas urumqiensis]
MTILARRLIQFLSLALLLVTSLPMAPLQAADGSAVGTGNWSDQAETSSLDLASGWEYRWGDSPFNESGIPAWTLDTDPANWQAIGFPSNPPRRDGRRHAWFRITLPEGEWRDPVLYIYSIDLIAQVYLGPRLIYQYGDFDERGEGRFAGWPWHLIQLPEDFAGQTLYFRVYSNYIDIGLWGEVKLMDRLALLEHVLDSSAKALATGLFSILLAVLAGIFALVGTQRRSFAAIALFSLAAGTMLIAETQASQLLANRPLLWDTLAASGYFTLPIAMGLLLEHWLTHHGRLLRSLWQLHLAYLVGAIGATWLGWIDLAITFPIFDALLLVTLPVMLVVAVRFVALLSIEQRLIIVSYAVFATLLLIDMAVAHGVLPWQRVPVSFGALGFSLAIVTISLWHYHQTQRELHQLNQSLERQVTERTSDLRQLVEKLEFFSYEDTLTGLKNRRHFDEMLQHEAAVARRQGTPLALAMIDIDHFKRFNDRFGHEAGDSVLAGIGELLRRHFRDSDVVCRMGGEEFVAILPGATPEQAEQRTAALIDEVRGLRFRHRGELLDSITLSCGIAAYPEHAEDPLALIGLADKALYHAKHQGRDRSETYPVE